jgi:hypothetical protein
MLEGSVNAMRYYGQPFVVFTLKCDCGVVLEIHGKHWLGTRGGLGRAACPTCHKLHDLPADPLGVIPLPPEVA